MRPCTIGKDGAMDEEQSSSIRMKLPPLNPELRDSIRTRLRLCLTCRALKRWSWPFHNAHPETYDRVHARHRLIQEQLAGCGGCGPSCGPRRNEMAPASGSAPGGRAMAEERSPIQHVLVMAALAVGAEGRRSALRRCLRLPRLLRPFRL